MQWHTSDNSRGFGGPTISIKLPATTCTTGYPSKLESRQGDEKGIDLWVPVAGLGASVLVSAMLETVKYWISYNKLVIRIQQQLILAIFDKAV